MASLERRFHRKLSKLFTKSSKFLRTDTRYIATSGLWTTLSRAVFLLSGFILTLGFANLLPLEEYGIYRFIISLGAIAGTFSLTGLGTSIIRAAARDTPGILRWGALTRLKWSIGIPIISFILAVYYFLNDNNTIAIGLLISGSFKPFLESFKIYNAFLTGKKEFKKNTLYGFGYRVFPVGILLIALFLTDNILILLFTYFFTNTFAMFVVFLKLLREYPERGSPDPDTLKYSKHLSAMNIFSGIVGHFDKILVFHFLGAAQLAIYAFATIPVTQLQGALRTSKSLLLPKLATRDLAEIKKSMPRKALLLFIATVPLVFLYILSAPFIYSIFFPQYIESVIYSQVFALVMLFFPLSIIGQTFIAHARKKELYILRTTTPIVQIVLLLIFVPLYGIWGVIGVLLGTRFLTTTLIVILFAMLTDKGHTQMPDPNSSSLD